MVEIEPSVHKCWLSCAFSSRKPKQRANAQARRHTPTHSRRARVRLLGEVHLSLSTFREMKRSKQSFGLVFYDGKPPSVHQGASLGAQPLTLTWPLPFAPQFLTTFTMLSLMITTVWKEPASIMVTGARSVEEDVLLLSIAEEVAAEEAAVEVVAPCTLPNPNTTSAARRRISNMPASPSVRFLPVRGTRSARSGEESQRERKRDSSGRPACSLKSRSGFSRCN